MVGQEKLFEQFNKFTLDTLPHAIMLVGSYGCGKHTFCKEIAEKFGLQLNIIADKINYDLLDQINENKFPVLCVINNNDISTKEEAVLLKFIEEPQSNIFIIIIAESTNNILDTILNRCQVYRFEDYSKEVLNQFYTPNPDPNHYQLALEIANTPGKMIEWSNQPLMQMYNYADKIFNMIGSVILGNVFNIVNKINFNRELNNNFLSGPFFAILLFCANCRVKNNKENALIQYNLTSDLISKLNIPNINQQQLFENYLCNLRQACKVE